MGEREEKRRQTFYILLSTKKYIYIFHLKSEGIEEIQGFELILNANM